MNLKVISLLNDYKSRESIEKGVSLLAQQFNIKDVFIKWSTCDYYASTNRTLNRITICPRIRTTSFNSVHSSHFSYPYELVTHFTIVILHEFGHVLYNNKSKFKNNLKDREESASLFAKQYIQDAFSNFKHD